VVVLAVVALAEPAAVRVPAPVREAEREAQVRELAQARAAAARARAPVAAVASRMWSVADKAPRAPRACATRPPHDRMARPGVEAAAITVRRPSFF